MLIDDGVWTKYVEHLQFSHQKDVELYRVIYYEILKKDLAPFFEDLMPVVEDDELGADGQDGDEGIATIMAKKEAKENEETPDDLVLKPGE